MAHELCADLIMFKCIATCKYITLNIRMMLMIFYVVNTAIGIFLHDIGNTIPTADSFLKTSHVVCTNTLIKSQLAAITYHFLQKAYTEYNNDQDEVDDLMSLKDWYTERAALCPQVHFWSIILQLELEVMIDVQAIREADFLLL